MWGKGWDEGGVRSVWEASAALRGCTGRTGPLVGEAGESWAQKARQRIPSRRQIPWSLRACSLLPHKGQKGTWEETGP